jgi:hypothetical protein
MCTPNNPCWFSLMSLLISAWDKHKFDTHYCKTSHCFLKLFFRSIIYTYHVVSFYHELSSSSQGTYHIFSIFLDFLWHIIHIWVPKTILLLLLFRLISEPTWHSLFQSVFVTCLW